MPRDYEQEYNALAHTRVGETGASAIMEAGKLAKMRFALQAVDHTLSVHGHIDADTPLHEVVLAALN